LTSLLIGLSANCPVTSSNIEVWG